jgi:hypothetical protein
MYVYIHSDTQKNFNIENVNILLAIVSRLLYLQLHFFILHMF